MYLHQRHHIPLLPHDYYRRNMHIYQHPHHPIRNARPPGFLFESIRTEAQSIKKVTYKELHCPTPTNNTARLFRNADMSPQQEATKYAGRMLNKAVFSHIDTSPPPPNESL